MSIENKKTLEVYNEKASKYLETSIAHNNLNPDKAKIKKKKLENFIKKCMEIIPKGKKVLEIGSANGDNAKYIEELGYDVTASDVANDFIHASKTKRTKDYKI